MAEQELWLRAVLLLFGFTLSSSLYNEKYRPQVHYSPPQHWMNDPNGLVFYDGVYHLFYQYNPNGKRFGIMHWGHAVSEDLMHWKPFGVALWPDRNGEIFSGCALVDDRNVTRLSIDSDYKALIAIFTQSLNTSTPEQLQQQSMAYSLDEGLTWNMYAKNPVLTNREFIDFRDPTVFPYEDHYIMILAAGDRVLFYKSTDLTHWTKLSEFGQHNGAHGGVWECPDLLRFEINGKPYWVLVVSINPGGPNGGNAMQYFLGEFDGVKFTINNRSNELHWVDHGPDCYAGDTYFGLKKPTFIAWMNNWLYAAQAPTDPWRGQMTIPRILNLVLVEGQPLLTSNPVPELKKLHTSDDYRLKNVVITSHEWTTLVTGRSLYDAFLEFNITELGENDKLEFCLSNSVSEKMCIGYSRHSNEYVIDRSRSGNVDFSPNFTKRATAPRSVNTNLMDWRLVIDVSSVEFFADGGVTAMTAVFFPSQEMDRITVSISSNEVISTSKVILQRGRFVRLKSIWEDI